MASADVKIDIAAEFTGKKAFKQAETASQKMEKAVAKLGKQLLAVFATQKIIAFGKASVKAFAADEKAARSLSLALANTGNAFASIGVEKFIADLQRTTGVLDDNLRPAFRTLLTATGDVKKSQDGLNLALDIAAGTGKDLNAVSMALAKAYGGQTTALSRLGAGLDKATLASGDMDLITGELTKKFKGQALSAAQGYSGQMDRLTVASQNAKEIIGKDLLDSLALLSGPGGISKATSQMEDLATSIGSVVYGLSRLIDKVKSIPGAAAVMGTFGDVLKNLQPFAYLRGLDNRKTGQASPGGAGGVAATIKYQKEQAKILKETNALNKIQNKDIKEKLALTAGEKALAELKKMFDLEGIQIQAALNGTISEEDRLRLNALQAINNSDTAMALLALNALKAAAASSALATAQEASLATWASWQTVIGNAFKAAATGTVGSTTGGTSPFVIPDYVPGQGTTEGQTGIPGMGGGASGGFGMGGWTAPSARPSSIIVNVSGSVTTERDLVSAITQGIYNNQASGVPINYTTQY